MLGCVRRVTGDDTIGAFIEKESSRELSRGTVRNAQRVASKQKSRLHRKMLRHRAERKRRKEGEPADNHNHAG